MESHEVVAGVGVDGTVEAATTTQKKATKVMSSYPVLQRIGKELSTRELLRLRTACREWNRAFAGELETKSTSFQLIKGHPSPYLQERTKFSMGSSTCNAFVAGEYRYSIFGSLPNLKTLVLVLASSETSPRPDPEDYPRGTLEKLRRLVLDLTCEGWYRGVGSSIHWLVVDIVANSPGLNYLTLRTNHLALQVLQALQPQNLQELYIGGPLTVEIVETLLQLDEKCHPGRLRLTSLKVVVSHLPNGQFDQLLQLLSSFLTQQARSLRHLQIGTEDFEAPVAGLCLPEMAKLEILELTERGTGHIQLVLQSQPPRMDINFPKLKKLVYSSTARHQFIPEVEIPLLGFQNITDLSLIGLEDTEVRRIAQGFPSVVRLSLETRYVLREQHDAWLSQVTFICGAWPKLDALRISGENWSWPQKQDEHEYEAQSTAPALKTSTTGPERYPNLDEVFTGIPREFHTRGFNVDELHNWSHRDGVPIDVEKLRPFQTRAGISDLVQLREFFFNAPGLVRKWDWQHRTAATDVTGYYCFARSGSNIQRIGISSNGATWTPTCGRAIRRSLGLTGRVVHAPEEESLYIYCVAGYKKLPSVNRDPYAV